MRGGPSLACCSHRIKPVPTTGFISLKSGETYYSLVFRRHGWIAGELVQYLDDILEAEDRQAAILKLLGYTLQIGKDKPKRTSGHWVIVDLDEHRLETNSDLLKRAVHQLQPAPDSPYAETSLKRIYAVLDRFEFTVEFYP